MNGFSIPNHTQCPNALFDDLMCEMGEAELRVTLAAIRKTLGYHKKVDPISITQFQKMTGLTRQGVLDGIEAAIARGLIRKAGTGKRNINIFELVMTDEAQLVKPVDQSSELTSSSQASRPVTSQASRHTKENVQKKINKKKVPRKPKWFDEDVLIDVWASIRKLDAIAMGADFHTEQDRRILKKMLGWPKPVSADELREVMKRSKHPAYPLSFLEKDVLALRSEKPAAVHPSHVPFAPVEDFPDAVAMPDEARAAMQSLTKSVHVNDEVIHAELAKSA